MREKFKGLLKHVFVLIKGLLRYKHGFKVIPFIIILKEMLHLKVNKFEYKF
jgi:hypothetical protein